METPDLGMAARIFRASAYLCITWRPRANKMGTGSSRGKVAPAIACEKSAFKTEDIVAVPIEGNHCKTLKIQTITNASVSRNRTEPDCHIGEHDSEFEDDLDRDLDGVLEKYEHLEVRSEKKHCPNNTYGLVISRPVDYDIVVNSPDHLQSSVMSDGMEMEMRKEHGPAVNENICIRVRNRFCKSTQMHILKGTRKQDLTSGTVIETMPTQSVPNKSQGSSLSKPVIRYNDSEVNLMETREREFG
ncbi:hypothetical protein DPEC_G00294090 [Dallia pectoralis]|uniref:Uncharacterized protein n=1 Tax=Dallia pectoralis TaxID=75939 RepID=A0ACC2FI82_DALPE|nr:hypothetical protein DPEC_G00294090 [Dallia pectoralis]